MAVWILFEVGVEQEECISGGLLFGFFFTSATSTRVDFGCDSGGDEEFAGVIRTGFFDDNIFGSAAEDTLGELLELTFEVFDIDGAT